MALLTRALEALKEHGPNTGLPNDPNRRLTGPWFETQLSLSLVIGLSSFIVFCIVRRVERWKVLYSPRTLLKGFSPHEVHDKPSFFGWVLPTLRTSEFTVLQIVGLDAAVLLSFLRMAFLFFLTCTVLAFTILVPVNYRENGTSEGVSPELPDNDNSTISALASLSFQAYAGGKASHGSTIYLGSHLAFTYAFSMLALYFLQRNYARYIPLRQLFSLELAHSIPARTVMVTALPPHLRSERTLAEYFESIQMGVHSGEAGLGVESVSVVRAVGGMKELLERRTKALRTLEVAWTKYLGNPVPVEGEHAVYGYVARQEVERIVDPEGTPLMTPQNGAAEGQLVDVQSSPPSSPFLPASNTDLEAALANATPKSSRTHIINPNRPRPTFRPTLLSKPVDALDYYAEEFRKADEEVKNRRKGKFRPTGVAFVTFESMASAQIVSQAVHYPSVDLFHTQLAPEPRDIQWNNLSISPSSVFVRQLLVTIALLILLSIWSVPVTTLAISLNWENVEKAMPRLAELIGRSPLLRTLVQNSLPSVVLIGFNNALPFFLEALSIFQGLQSRSEIEYSLLKKYHLSILFTTFFLWVTASTWTLLREVADSPQKVLDKLATLLPGGRNFFVSYVMLSGLAIMPLQLLELAVIIPRIYYKTFITRTPRDHAELNAPPMLNLGTIYPQAILIFTIGLCYSIISPRILPFTTLYFGIAYLVYKYKLLFVYYRPYESRGQAWPITFNRIALGILIFQTFMLSLFIFRQAILLAALMAPLILGTLYTSFRIHNTYKPLSQFVNLSQASEVASTEGGDIMKLRKGHPVTRSQSNLNRGRYGANDDGLYVVGQNDATDYAQPPVSGSYPGVLNTGRRRYGHPALSGALPDPWLPILATSSATPEAPKVARDALVLDLRRQWSRVKRAARTGANTIPGVNLRHSPGEEHHGMEDEDPSRAWRGSSASVASRRDSIGEAEVEDFVLVGDDEEAEGNTRYSTYFHHRSPRSVPGAYPPQSAEETDDEGPL